MFFNLKCCVVQHECVASVVACAAHCAACTVAGQCTSGQCQVGWMDGASSDCIGEYILSTTTTTNRILYPTFQVYQLEL